MRHFLTSIVAMAMPASAIPAAMAQTLAVPTAAEQAELDHIVARGRLMRAYDRAAWLGTDDVLERIPDARNRIGGWIVDGPEATPTVIFHDRARPPHALYSARLVGDRLVDTKLPTDDAATLPPERLRLIAARDVATRTMNAAGLRSCTSPFNTLVIPPATAGAPTSVYFLTPQTKVGELPIGGHYRVDVAADGTAGTPYAFSKSCMTLPPPENGRRVALAAVSTLTAPLPNETHSFVVEAYRRPLVVIIPNPSRAFILQPGRPARPFTMTDTRAPSP